MGRRRSPRGTSSPVPACQTEPGVVVYRFGAGVFYANAQRLTDETLELAGGDDPPEWFILDGSSIDDVDFTGGKTLAELADQLRQRGIVVAAANMRGSVQRELQRFRVTTSTGQVRVFDTVEEALAAFREETGRR